LAEDVNAVKEARAVKIWKGLRAGLLQEHEQVLVKGREYVLDSSQLLVKVSSEGWNTVVAKGCSPTNPEAQPQEGESVWDWTQYQGLPEGLNDNRSKFAIRSDQHIIKPSPSKSDWFMSLVTPAIPKFQTTRG
jgi:hypothetical protein